MKKFMLMAGGTGGHLFPAMALAQELIRRGHAVELMTDHRVESYGADFPASAIHIVPSATPSLTNPFKFLAGGFRILGGIAVAFGKLRKARPDCVIGFGGYPTFPPFVAASLLGIPGILHEQNAVMGRANRALARFADILAMSYDRTKFADQLSLEKLVTGNPVRDRVRAVAGTPYPALGGDSPIRLVIFGGSQGAKALSDIVPAAIASMPEGLRHRLHIVQQCRAEDLDRVAETYRQAKVNVELAAFFTDLPERMSRSHLVIGRSGASTIAELTVLGRPAILVPLPGAVDADQKNNAMVVDTAGAGWLAEQATLSPQSLGTRLTNLLDDPATLTRAAAAARALGQPRAVEKLADLAEMLSGKNLEVDTRS
ncbi:MAG: undecaprenyldiphospho-muramoylpentapeptide beta-N-acetylglucosaminyltransferase [Alphaproteobacteria bacterium]|jgi:UDP-N-acetylglucosamine--N-acetylmuramyl-(pentapeptide) pyrophosphoryl-undecaprenol N-acetylglucosamine transferase|nr:undecaprenyldiphospho-muramoylpentapeptide beta-N-acetylglucosaminyltransferase [Alphaproteobacteria bacterium]MBU1559895.1 undecaprenyldiphospho-muramoylpentapeptide beta-N-acetylglucosaminyltransferase [Alphaproteobacteria bacterium]MBU2302197.1 undecaprenyldiphospho-muramoylpentapeptide beta-N-acetylglucosaminyltransferase [Alphaproteobacteria bacterium]MBU2369503.1 undecaprenyldiphospho-muramoylpentapeptide beta-N-acetylglucosaminyltransferase [Alphaproteobacteria bacterium]